MLNQLGFRPKTFFEVQNTPFQELRVNISLNFLKSDINQIKASRKNSSYTFTHFEIMNMTL